MKIISKNLLILGVIAALSTMPLFAQQGEQGQPKERPALNLSHRVGGYVSYEPVLGPLHQFVFCSIGGGAEYELGFPFLKVFEIGPAVHFGINDNIITDERLSFMMNLKFDVGCFFRITFGKSGFVLSPEFDYGLLVYFPKISEGYSSSGSFSGVYVDQLIQIGVGVRYSHEKILNGNLEFELTPTYLFSAEQENLIHYLGFRLGALYKIGGKK
ncbi:MAG: hypothetical protein K6G52_02655 [Treponemataceae bacterium]|nr:hypothetical protein [Treponemataceae bacterium]